MTVAELIEELRQYPQDARVVLEHEYYNAGGNYNMDHPWVGQVSVRKNGDVMVTE